MEYAKSEKYQDVLKESVEKKYSEQRTDFDTYRKINHDLDSDNNNDVLHGLKNTLVRENWF